MFHYHGDSILLGTHAALLHIVAMHEADDSCAAYAAPNKGTTTTIVNGSCVTQLVWPTTWHEVMRAAKKGAIQSTIGSPKLQTASNSMHLMGHTRDAQLQGGKDRLVARVRR